mgnify:CR=1 FL=1
MGRGWWWWGHTKTNLLQQPVNIISLVLSMHGTCPHLDPHLPTSPHPHPYLALAGRPRLLHIVQQLAGGGPDLGGGGGGYIHD